MKLAVALAGLLSVTFNASAIEISVLGGHWGTCKLASTAAAGQATVSLEALGGSFDSGWHPHMGLALTDGDNEIVYKLSVAVDENLNFRDAQQTFSFGVTANQQLYALHVLPVSSAPLQRKVEMTLAWDADGMFSGSLNGASIGRVKLSREFKNLRLFASGMRARVEGNGVDLSPCEKLVIPADPAQADVPKSSGK